MNKYESLTETGAELIGRYCSMLDLLRQPQVAAEETADPDQQDGGAKHRTDTGYGNGEHEWDGEKNGKEHEAVPAKNVPNLGQPHLTRRQVVNHRLEFGTKGICHQFSFCLFKQFR
jgi:hypothetical protein